MLRHRQHRRWQTNDPSAAFSSTSIFITPMLDMSFQLLAFFVFTYHPVALEGQFPIALAAGESGGELRPKDPQQRAAPGEPALRPLVTVQARADFDGNLDRLDVLFAGVSERISFEGQSDVALEKLLAALQHKLLEIRRALPADPKDPRSQSLLILASDRLKWEPSVRIMDACRRALDEAGRPIELFPRLELDILR
jgi:hypothetical protein